MRRPRHPGCGRLDLKLHRAGQLHPERSISDSTSIPDVGASDAEDWSWPLSHCGSDPRRTRQRKEPRQCRVISTLVGVCATPPTPPRCRGAVDEKVSAWRTAFHCRRTGGTDMSIQDPWQLAHDAAVAYERDFVPAIFALVAARASRSCGHKIGRPGARRCLWNRHLGAKIAVLAWGRAAASPGSISTMACWPWSAAAARDRLAPRRCRETALRRQRFQCGG